MPIDPPRWLLCSLFILGACSKREPEHFGLPVGLRLHVAGVTFEAALAVSSPEEPLPLVPKVAELLSAALPACADARARLREGQVLRFRLRAKQGSIVAADSGEDATTACLTRKAMGREVGSTAELSLVIELREKGQ